MTVPRWIGLTALLFAPADDVTYSDITGASKVEFRHQGSGTSNKYLIETMGGGVALFDFDADGRLDIFFVNGAWIGDPMPAGRMPDKPDPKYWNRLYRQLPDGTFEDVTGKAGLSGAKQGFYGMGVAVGDYDNDGFPDLYVTNYGSNTLYHNNGDGTFTDVTERAGVKEGGWSTSAGFVDYDNDGWLDLMVGRYVEWSFETNRYCGEAKPGGRAYCHPDNFPPVSSILYHNNGDGTFSDVSAASGIGAAKGKTLGLSFADFDGDGWTDIFAANDSVQCFLFHNQKNGTFKDIALPAGVGFNEDGATFAGMGTDFTDFDNDGLPDIVVTDLSDQRYMLFRNNGDGTFTDVTNASGLGRATLEHSGWSTRFIDYDNDGWKDLFVAQGHVLDTIESTTNRKYMEPPLLLRNIKGQLTKVSPGTVFEKVWAGRGAAFGDIDNDGDIDIVVANVNQPAYVLRNEGGSRKSWLGLDLRGTKSNRDGIGAKVKVVGESGLAQHYWVNTAVGYQSASDRRLIVGLGNDKTVRLVEVHWPSGVVQKLENVKARQMLKVTEPKQ